ncbi:MAG: DUF2513 domain-containing protein [Bacteroidetes bacterium]|nr:DUF2513 domain-containing protein [Bacteroidota bacterium]
MRLINSLLYDILVFIEGHEGRGPYKMPEKLGDYTIEQVNYHIRMCEKAGFIEPGRSKIGLTGYPSYFELGELTWEGHQEIHRRRNGK